MTPTETSPADLRRELRELAGWLDDLADALTNKAHPMTPAAGARQWMREQAARCQGRAFLTRQTIGEAPGQTPPQPVPVFLVLRGDGAYMAAGTDPAAASWFWTTDPASVRQFTTQAEAERFAQAVPKRQRRGCSLSITAAEASPAQAEPAPLAATADHIAGSCEFCPVGGGGCPVCTS